MNIVSARVGKGHIREEQTQTECAPCPNYRLILVENWFSLDWLREAQILPSINRTAQPKDPFYNSPFEDPAAAASGRHLLVRNWRNSLFDQ